MGVYCKIPDVKYEEKKQKSTCLDSSLLCQQWRGSISCKGSEVLLYLQSNKTHYHMIAVTWILVKDTGLLGQRQDFPLQDRARWAAELQVHTGWDERRVKRPGVGCCLGSSSSELRSPRLRKSPIFYNGPQTNWLKIFPKRRCFLHHKRSTMSNF